MIIVFHKTKDEINVSVGGMMLCYKALAGFAFDVVRALRMRRQRVAIKSRELEEEAVRETATGANEVIAVFIQASLLTLLLLADGL